MFYFMMIEIGKISHSRKILVSPPFEGRAGPPPTFSRLRHPLAPCLVSQIYFGRFFRAPRWSPSIRLRSEVQGVPCSRSNWGSSSTSTWTGVSGPRLRAMIGRLDHGLSDTLYYERLWEICSKSLKCQIEIGVYIEIYFDIEHIFTLEVFPR